MPGLKVCEWMGTRAWSLENVLLLGEEEEAAVEEEEEEEEEVATAALGRAAADANRTCPRAYPQTRARRMASRRAGVWSLPRDPG